MPAWLLHELAGEVKELREDHLPRAVDFTEDGDGAGRLAKAHRVDRDEAVEIKQPVHDGQSDRTCVDAGDVIRIVGLLEML